MLVEEFEQIAHSAPESVWLEFIDGRLRVKPAPDGNHSEIVVWLIRRCIRQRPDLALYPFRGLQIEDDHVGRAIPDGVLAPRRHFAGHGDWSKPTGVLMTVDITSNGHDTDQRDIADKRDGYAAAGIPFHLLIDRDEYTLTVHSQPQGGKYRSLTTRPFGSVIEIPDPGGITLETQHLQDFAD